MPQLAPRAPVKSDLPYMTASERYTLKEKRESGEISFFRVRQCSAKCGAEVPELKLYCSKECYDGHRERNKRESGAGEHGDAE